MITLPTDCVLLDDRTSIDPDGSISSYIWTKISGPASLFYFLNNETGINVQIFFTKNELGHIFNNKKAIGYYVNYKT